MTTRIDRRGIALQSQDGGQAIKNIHTRNAIASIPLSHIIVRQADRTHALSTMTSPPRRSPRSPCRLGGASMNGTKGADSRADRREPPQQSIAVRSRPTKTPLPEIDGHVATGQAVEAMSDWMSSDGVDYTASCGHERHRMGSKHSPRLSCWMTGREAMRTRWARR